LRLDEKLVDALEELKWRNRTDRTTEISKACEFYVTAIECPKCGTLNAKHSNYCSICQTPLSELAKAHGRCTDLLTAILQNDERYHELLNCVLKKDAGPNQKKAGWIKVKDEWVD